MKKICIAFLLVFSANYLLAQNLCGSPSGTVAGGFTFDGPNSGCPPLTIKLKDVSGGTDINYVYVYKGENANKLNTLSPDNTGTFTYLDSGTYTILQYGKKNGKDMYFCATVNVFDSPKFTYNSCGGNTLQLTLPKVPANNFDYYEIDWDDGLGTKTKVYKNAIPATILYTSPSGVNGYTAQLPTRNIKVDGFITGKTTCATSPVTVNMFGGGTDFPNLTKIELSDDGTEATLQLKGGDGIAYTLGQRASSDPPFLPYFANGTTVNAGAINVKIPDTTKSYCFIVQRPGLCSYYQSNEICTIFLKAAPLDAQYNHVEWTSHYQRTTGFTPKTTPSLTYKIYRQEIDGATTTISRGGLSFDDPIDCQKTYCYQAELTVLGETSFNTTTPPVQAVSLSQKRCIDRKNIQAPPITVGLVSVNDKSQVEATWTDNLTWQPKRKKYIFLRADSQGGKFEKIDSIVAPLAKYIDTKIDASQKQYCYEITFEDECGSISKPSTPFCSVLLTYENKELYWTSELPFDANIDHYEIEAYDEVTHLPISEKSQTTTIYSPQIDKFQNEAKYRIKATSKSGEISYSNVFVIPITVAILFPEAFTPNSDTKNDTFLPVGRLGRIKNFNLTFFNRWGDVVSVVSDIKEGWNGNLSNGEKAPEGIYAFKAEATLDDGTLLTRYGKVLLLW